MIVLGLSPVSAETLRVTPSGDGDVTSIHQAIASASNGDVIVLAPGRYTISEPVRFNGKKITVKSETNATETVIRMENPADDSQASVVVFQSGENEESILEGLTLSGGGGVDLEGAAPGSPRHVGGGIFCAGSAAPLIRDCRIMENVAGPAGGAGRTFGGGISCWGESSPILERCVLTNNEARFGGAVNCRENATATLVNCLIAENLAWKGGAADCDDAASFAMWNCTIASNRTSDPRVGVQGLRLGSGESSLVNCIVWGHNFEPVFGRGTISYSCIESGYNGPGNFDDDPMLDPVSYRLLAGSPCIDTGTERGAPNDDLELRSRPCGDGVDIGAFELCPEILTIRITDVFKIETDLTVQFVSNPGISDWIVMGSSNLVSFVDNKTGDSIITETAPGVYKAVVDVSSEPDRYFVRIGR